MNLAAVDGATDTRLSATGWQLRASGGSRLASITLSDSDGSASWNERAATWTLVSLSARLTYHDGPRFFVEYYQSIND